jgi:predicted O-methyltransferase YrrM
MEYRMGDWLKFGGWLAAGLMAGYWWGRRQIPEQTNPAPNAEQIETQRRNDFRQQQALFSLFAQLPLRAPLPYLRGYAISPDFALVLMDVVRTHQPRLILELGCGTSTLINAYVLEQLNQGGRVISLEHDAEFARRTRQNLQRHGLDAIAQVIDAPLVLPPNLNWQGQWYDLAQLPDLNEVDLLVVDGPPQYSNPHPMARYPAVPMLLDRLKVGALIVVDDADRDDERRSVERWLRDHPVKVIDRPETEKGTVILAKI